MMAQTAARRQFTCMLIDLDDTLYRVPEIPLLVRDNIAKYMQSLGIPEAEIPALNQKLYTNHGTTMLGLLMNGYKLDFNHWHEEVHLTLPYNELLHPDPALRAILTSIRLPKYILTNADLRHAKICLERLGLQDVFQGVIGFENLNEAAKERGMLSPTRPVLCKPDKQAYELALEMIGADIHSTIFFDDSLRNIRSAHQAGMFSVMVGSDAHVVAGADLVITDMHQLPYALPELFPETPAHEMESEHVMPISVQA